MLGNFNACFPGNQFQGFMISGNNNPAFMGGIPCLTPLPVTYAQMLSIQSAHLRAMSGFFNGQDAVFSPINNTVQLASNQNGMNELPVGTLPNHVDDYGPTKNYSGSVPSYDVPVGTLPNHVDDYGPTKNHSGSVPSYDVPVGTLPNHVDDYRPTKNHYGSVPSYDVPVGTLPNHVDDYRPKLT